jgi:hypothetical protein
MLQCASWKCMLDRRQLRRPKCWAEAEDRVITNWSRYYKNYGIACCVLTFMFLMLQPRRALYAGATAQVAWGVCRLPERLWVTPWGYVSLSLRVVSVTVVATAFLFCATDVGLAMCRCSLVGAVLCTAHAVARRPEDIFLV